MNYIGVDIGGHFTKVGLVQNEKLVYKTKAPTPKGEQAIFETVFSLIDKILQAQKPPSGIGIGIAGLVLADKGLLLSAINLGLGNIDFAKIVHQKYNVPVKICNDVSAFALAEARTQKTDNLVFVTIGTGINVGVVNNGKLFAGANGASLEYGHTALYRINITSDTKAECAKEKLTCQCGLVGCVESLVSGTAIMNNAKRANLSASRPEDVFEKYKTNSAAKEIIDNFINALGVMLTNICNTYRPEKIFLGGGLSASLAPFMTKLNKILKENNYGYKNAPAVTVHLSTQESDGGVLGAALLF